MICGNEKLIEAFFKKIFTFLRSLLASASSTFLFSVSFGDGTAMAGSRRGFRSTWKQKKICHLVCEVQVLIKTTAGIEETGRAIG